MAGHVTRPLAERFWEKVDIKGADDCWEWQSALIYSGYGMFWHDGRARMAHRIAYKLESGCEAKNEIMHSCDNRSCCNPAHLSDGTHAENMDDARQKGRVARGESSGVAILTESDVRQIRQMWASGHTSYEIGEQFEIDNSHAWRVATRKIWKHVD